MRARLLDLGQVSAVRSQTLYHAVAECAAPDDRATLCVLRPDRPYVSIGYHQDAAREIDLAFCRACGLPVIRRRIGGGAVLLDADQLFFHFVAPRARLADLGLPGRLDRRYERLVAPAIAAYRRLGVRAEFRPVNDIHVEGRKIGGTGAADIGESFVFVGSMMLAFDHALMARVLRLADEGMREGVRRSIERFVTSLEEVRGVRPALEEVHAALLAGFGEALGLELEPGRLGEAEEARCAELTARFESEEWLHRVTWSRTRPRKLAINCAVHYVEGETVDGVRVAVRLLDGRVDDVRVSGGATAETPEVIALTAKLVEAATA
ncbi:MAG: lipoate--protein ligase family protein [Deltaproteobacteria bacterium]|nr:lipoate--protein ligase family protein [Deltaproteobacteria bacterium]